MLAEGLGRQPRGSVGRQAAVGDGPAGEQDLAVGRKPRWGRAEVDSEDEPRLAGEAEQPFGVEPAQRAPAEGGVFAAQPQGRPVQAQEGALVSELRLDAVLAPVRRLGQPGFGGARTIIRSGGASPGGHSAPWGHPRPRWPGTPRESKTFTGAGPGDGYAAAVAAGNLAGAAAEP